MTTEQKLSQVIGWANVKAFYRGVRAIKTPNHKIDLNDIKRVALKHINQLLLEAKIEELEKLKPLGSWTDVDIDVQLRELQSELGNTKQESTE